MSEYRMEYTYSGDVRTEGLEELPEVLDFICAECGYEWDQKYIIGVTDI